MKNNKLEYFLFKENCDLNTESVCESLDMNLANYIVPNTVTHGSSVSEFELKDKLLKIKTSLKSFNILGSNLNTLSAQLSSNNIENLFKNSHKNNLVDLMADFVVELIWKVKEESMQKDNLIEKINFLHCQKDDVEKNNKKLRAEISECKKEMNRLLNSTMFQKEKLEKSKKLQTSEFNELKSENKKLTTLLTNLKNDGRKKESEYVKIQEKLKKFFGTSVAKNQNFDMNESIQNKQKINTDESALLIFSKAQFESTREKLELLKNQNSFLLSILKQIKTFFESFCKNSNNLLSSVKKEYFVDLLSIKDGIFSMHLLDMNLLDEFYTNFTSNLSKFEALINILLDLRIEHKEDSMIFDSKNKENDMLKNLKKWGLSTNKKSPSKVRWFERIDQPREINYFYNEKEEIKYDSDDVEMRI